MSAQVSTHLNEIPTKLREPAKSIRPEAPPQGDHGGLISGESRKETFDLTPLEQQIVALTAAGCSREEKASTVGVSEEALDAHLNTIFAKLGVSNEFELILFAVYHRIVPTPDGPEGIA
jgi:DNA-binding CsgD family transcriptional regulator